MKDSMKYRDARPFYIDKEVWEKMSVKSKEQVILENADHLRQPALPWQIWVLIGAVILLGIFGQNGFTGSL